MAYTYKVYGTGDVDNAVNNYNRVASSAPTYADSSETRQARQQADNYANSYTDKINKGYTSKYKGAIDELANQYQKNKFDWTPENSSEYQQKKEKYTREGKVAQENVQGSYAANTGGYSNTYSQTAGQKAFGEYMDELANKVPTLKNEAYKSYQQQQEDTLNRIGVLQNLDNTQYQRYRDSVTDDYDFMTYYENKYGTSKGLDMSNFQNELAHWQTQMSAAQSNLSDIRSLAEAQYEHNTLSADTRSSIDSQRRQSDAYYNYLNSQVKIK